MVAFSISKYFFILFTAFFLNSVLSDIKNCNVCIFPVCFSLPILSLLTFLNHFVLDVYSLELDWALRSILKAISTMGELNALIFIEVTDIFGFNSVIFFYVVFSLCIFIFALFLNVVLIFRKVCIFALRAAFIKCPRSTILGVCILIPYYAQQENYLVISSSPPTSSIIQSTELSILVFRLNMIKLLLDLETLNITL